MSIQNCSICFAEINKNYFPSKTNNYEYLEEKQQFSIKKINVCMHAFHENCLKGWQAIFFGIGKTPNDTSCPNCRKKFKEVLCSEDFQKTSIIDIKDMSLSDFKTCFLYFSNKNNDTTVLKIYKNLTKDKKEISIFLFNHFLEKKNFKILEHIDKNMKFSHLYYEFQKFFEKNELEKATKFASQFDDEAGEQSMFLDQIVEKHLKDKNIEKAIYTTKLIQSFMRNDCFIKIGKYFLQNNLFEKVLEISKNIKNISEKELNLFIPLLDKYIETKKIDEAIDLSNNITKIEYQLHTISKLFEYAKKQEDCQLFLNIYNKTIIVKKITKNQEILFAKLTEEDVKNLKILMKMLWKGGLHFKFIKSKNSFHTYKTIFFCFLDISNYILYKKNKKLFHKTQLKDSLLYDQFDNLLQEVRNFIFS
jgi:hypothetical protein